MSGHEPKTFFVGGQGNQSKTDILYFVTQKGREILEWAIKGEKPGIDRGTYAFERKMAAGQF